MNLPIRYAHFPKPLHDVVGELIPNKKSVTSWLLAKPGLLGWRLDIHWLWSSPASLYGLDRIGSLIIVRIVIDDGTDPNPFKNSAAEITSATINRSWSASALRPKWLTQLGPDRFHSSDYSNVDKCLKLRERSGNPFPVFFGLVASSRSDFGLSWRARKDLGSIQKRAGDERAGVRVISASISSTRMRVQCRTPEGI
ncbi:MAG TPA: hypothetical protein VFT08_03755 [Pyrinomonadaceae bacterium]|nr:hypothetical protein [Pyrinomonadaceae bacterium]